MIKTVYWSSCKVNLFFSYFNETWIFSTDVGKILKYQVSWQFVQWKPSCSIRTDRQTWESWYSLFAILRKRLKKSLLCLLSSQYLMLKINRQFSFHIRFLCHGIIVRLWWYTYSITGQVRQPFGYQLVTYFLTRRFFIVYFIVFDLCHTITSISRHK